MTRSIREGVLDEVTLRHFEATSSSVNLDIERGTCELFPVPWEVRADRSLLFRNRRNLLQGCPVGGYCQRLGQCVHCRFPSPQIERDAQSDTACGPVQCKPRMVAALFHIHCGMAVFHGNDFPIHPKRQKESALTDGALGSRPVFGVPFPASSEQSDLPVTL